MGTATNENVPDKVLAVNAVTTTDPEPTAPLGEKPVDHCNKPSDVA